MFDIWMGDIELTTVVLIFSVVVLLPIQLLLCFKIKSRVIRLLPVIVLSVLTIILVCVSLGNPDWIVGLVYLIFSFFTGFMLIACGIGWGIWAIVGLIK